MGNIYSAQNVAAYFIYELNERKQFVNADVLQFLLAEVESVWNERFGHSAFSEEKANFTEKPYIINEVYNTYKEFGQQHLDLPAKEWYLEYGQFQLVYRTIGVPPLTAEEKLLMNLVINKYYKSILKKVS